MPISSHLHGTWLSHLNLMLHNLGLFNLFHCCVRWIFLFQWYGTGCYQNCAIHCYWIIKANYCHLLNILFGIRSILAPHHLVLCTTAVHHSLVVYVGTVDLLILLVFYDGNAASLFQCTLTWRRGIFVPCSPNQNRVRCISPLPIYKYIIVLFEYTYEVVGMFFALEFYSKVVNCQGERYQPQFVFP